MSGPYNNSIQMISTDKFHRMNAYITIYMSIKKNTICTQNFTHMSIDIDMILQFLILVALCSLLYYISIIVVFDWIIKTNLVTLSFNFKKTLLGLVR